MAGEAGVYLVVNKPELYAEPEVGAARKATGWNAGVKLEVLQRAAEDGASTDTTRGWYRVQMAGKPEESGWLHAALVAPVADHHAGAIGEERVDRWNGLAPDYAPDDLVKVGPGYSDGVDYRLRSQAAQALESMIDVARAEGIRLYVVSAYRPWSTQQRLYENKIRSAGWDQDTVARPGHSEHQLGTTVDLTDGDLDHLLKESFGETRAGRWLRENAWIYGFAQTYTTHNREQTGYAPEPWHYRYWGLEQARRRHLEALGELTD